jgi:hypothetical protein
MEPWQVAVLLLGVVVILCGIGIGRIQTESERRSALCGRAMVEVGVATTADGDATPPSQAALGAKEMQLVLAGKSAGGTDGDGTTTVAPSLTV